MAKVSIAVRITWSEGEVVDRSRDYGWGRYSDAGGEVQSTALEPCCLGPLWATSLAPWVTLEAT